MHVHSFILAEPTALSVLLVLSLCDPLDRSPPAHLSLGVLRQEYCSGLPFPSPRDLSNPEIEPVSPVFPALQADSLSGEPLEKPSLCKLINSA